MESAKATSFGYPVRRADVLLDTLYYCAVDLHLAARKVFQKQHRVYFFVCKPIIDIAKGIASNDIVHQYAEFENRRMPVRLAIGLLPEVSQELEQILAEVHNTVLKHWFSKDVFGYYVDDENIFRGPASCQFPCPFLDPFPLRQPFLAPRSVQFVWDILERGEVACPGLSKFEQRQAAWLWFESLGNVNKLHHANSTLRAIKLSSEPRQIKLEYGEVITIPPLDAWGLPAIPWN
ncbi:hypothetical protein QAD02_000030 [Eretmocerus hayati]|uniref:Uncharacterized protein n=1 Tax=Eretmocerus hayati TaxID=131215 RepID=A0ACC2NDQ0_9HYME|nr:hypothetical protein QAD02_000030 [Eretmocerus hayati]